MCEILFVTRPITPPWTEGSKNTAMAIAREAPTGYRFHLMTTRSDGNVPTVPNITWRPIYTEPNLSARQHIRLSTYLVRIDPEIDILHYLFVPTPLSSAFLHGITRLNAKLSVQTVPSLHKANVSSLEARALFFADRIVALSDWTAHHLRKLGVEGVVRINPGIDTERFKPAEVPARYRSTFSLPQDAVLALFSGELSRLGSVEIMLSVMPRILAQNPSVHFVFACPIRLPRDRVIRQQAMRAVEELGIDNRVHFVGEVNDFSELLNACDIFLFPVASMTGKIDIPLTVLEAMATGLPVVATDIRPLDEIFKDDIGCLVSPASTGHFAESVLALAADATSRREKGRRAREVVRNHYDVKKMSEAYSKVYAELH